MHPERITWEDKELTNNVDYDGIGFPGREKDFSKIEMKNKICINVYCHENKLVFPTTFQIKNLKARWNCCSPLMKTSHITCISRF